LGREKAARKVHAESGAPAFAEGDRMPEEKVSAWPERIQFSMAPFGYTVLVKRTEANETCVAYQCNKCEFKSSFDPRDMQPESAEKLFRWHVDQSH
jgi:hypothetical protein